MKILLCAIAKCENNYIREWVKHYKDIGFDNIVIYDNNDEDGEDISAPIKDFVDSGFVILEDYRGLRSHYDEETKVCSMQEKSYNECYAKYGSSYDWIAFFDCDEFLEFEDCKDIKEYFSKYNIERYNCVRFCWKNYTDSGIISINGNYSVKRFSKWLKDTAGKSIIRTGMGLKRHITAHGSKSARPVCDAVGNEIQYLERLTFVAESPVYKGAWINHYRWKTIEEYIRKRLRGYPDMPFSESDKKITFDKFFKENEKTDEKLEIIKKYTGGV
jgi:hypothetical protein